MMTCSAGCASWKYVSIYIVSMVSGREFEVGSHHPEPETDVEHAQACGGYPIEEETGGFAHCGQWWW